MSKVYIAAPFFNDVQLNIVESIKAKLKSERVEFFSPKDESMFKQGDNPKDILDLNCKAIQDAPYIIVVTDDKDVGTIWEAGYAYAIGKPIIYLWLGYDRTMKFNIMLAASGVVTHTYKELLEKIVEYKYTDVLTRSDDSGMLYE